MTATRPVPVKPYFGGFVLETLTVGMYEEARNAIREYIQNGFDSIQRAVHELKQLEPGAGLIRVTFDEDRKGLTIRDNGAGLPVRLAGETLVSIGASRKSYRSDAGFRGIGRLAGIVFSNTVTFRTKASGEAEATEVVFDALRMRELMSPDKGSEQTAADLISECVRIGVYDVQKNLPPFFEVELKGFTEAPLECSDPKVMARFLSQVAPVPYRENFEFGGRIRAYGKKFGLPIEEVAVVVEGMIGDKVVPLEHVFKPYTPEYEVRNADGLVRLVDVEFFESPTRRWWGWLGMKVTPGSYTNADVRGVRIRVKNIQIDGEGVVRSIFQKRSSSTARYQDWFVGEIFVSPTAISPDGRRGGQVTPGERREQTVTPNARRDGFEDSVGWRTLQKEIADKICTRAGESAQHISNEGQLTFQKLSEKTENQTKALELLRRSRFQNPDRTIALSATVTEVQKDITRAMRNADPVTAAQLQQLASQLMDVKTEVFRHLGSPEPDFDRETVEHDARQALLVELMAMFEDQLPAPCLATVRNLVRDEYDFPSG